jgi:Na+-translocating ferredoxin:NAD+ oxidoreductase RNF subunit RnfB
MMPVVYSLIVLGIMGLAAGIILAYASKKFAAWEDPKVSQIEEILPAVNCGACGYAGCHAYAVAVAAGKAKLNLCKPGAAKVAEEIGTIMGQEVEETEPMVAQRYCNGGLNETRIKFEYDSPKTCKAASVVNNGFKACSYSCLGLGDCAKVCPVEAITMDENNLPQIDKDKCIGCEQCVLECPRNILHMAPKKARVHVRCSSKDPGKVVTKACTVGCIACKLCEKACPLDAIHVIDNLAVIDYSKCKNCTKCAQACPRKIITVTPLPPKPKEEKKEGEEEKKE